MIRDCIGSDTEKCEIHGECMLLRIKQDMEKYYEGHDIWSLHHSKIPKKLLNEFYEYSSVMYHVPLHPKYLQRDYDKVTVHAQKYIHNPYRFHRIRPLWTDLYSKYRIQYYKENIEDMINKKRLTLITLDIMHDVLSNELRIELGNKQPSKMPHLWSSLALLELIKTVTNQPRLDI